MSFYTKRHGIKGWASRLKQLYFLPASFELCSWRFGEKKAHSYKDLGHITMTFKPLINTHKFLYCSTASVLLITFLSPNPFS